MDLSILFVTKSKFLAKAMSFGIVAKDGFVRHPVWIDGASLSSNNNQDMLASEVFPVLDRCYGRGNYVLI